MPFNFENSSLKKCFMSELDPILMSELNAFKEIIFLKKGSLIYKEGSPSRGVYFVKTGKIKIAKTGQARKESIVQIAGVGDLIGHYNTFTDTPCYCSATALEDSVVYFLQKDIILGAIEKNPSLGMQIIRKISREVYDAKNRFTSVVQKNNRERTAELFIKLANSYGVIEAGRIKIDIRLTREEMASMIGTVNETITRFITEFKVEGLIEEDGKSIYIIDKERLMVFANIQPRREVTKQSPSIQFAL